MPNILKLLIFCGICISCSNEAQISSYEIVNQEYEYSPKVTQGVNAEQGQFPFMVSIKNQKTDKHRCGGSIITNKWVLTAAHCCFTNDDGPQYIFSGTVFLNGTGRIHEIAKYIINENYAPDDAFKNDICLVKIEDEFEFNDRVQPIVLPVQDWPVNDGDLLSVSGWGWTVPGFQITPNQLQAGYNFTALSNERCYNLTDVDMYDGYLCAQGSHRGQSICFGDSGSPLVKDGIQVGIVSFLISSYCSVGAADFYTRVPKYVTWIQENLGADSQHLKLSN